MSSEFLKELPLGKTYCQIMDSIECIIRECEDKNGLQQYLIFSTEESRNGIIPGSKPYNDDIEAIHVHIPNHSSVVGKTIFLHGCGFSTDTTPTISIHYVPIDMEQKFVSGNIIPVYLIYDINSDMSKVYYRMFEFLKKPLHLSDVIEFNEYSIRTDVYGKDYSMCLSMAQMIKKE
jgi:hypothetical protein